MAKLTPANFMIALPVISATDLRVKAIEPVFLILFRDVFIAGLGQFISLEICIPKPRTFQE
jgi:hypothetical protein